MPSKTVNAVEFFDEVFESSLSSGLDEKGESAALNDADEAGAAFVSHKQVVRCFHLRFFERFCVPFGILRDLSEPRLFGRPTDVFEKTDFFISDFPKIVGSTSITGAIIDFILRKIVEP